MREIFKTLDKSIADLQIESKFKFAAINIYWWNSFDLFFSSSIAIYFTMKRFF